MFNDRELDSKVKYKLGIFDGSEPSEEELEKINEILISNQNARGEKIGVDLSEIIRLKNLKFLDLKGFILTPEILKTIESMKNLIGITLYECQSNEPVIVTLDKLKNMILDACDLQFACNIDSLESLLIVNGGTVDVSKLPIGKKIKEIGINNSEIVNADLFGKMESLKNLNIDGSVLDNENILKELLSNKVSVSNEYEYHPIK